MYQTVRCLVGVITAIAVSAIAVPASLADPPTDAPPPIDLPPELLESPTLQRWLEDVPNIEADIRQDPSFRTRLRLGYSNADGADGLAVGIEDVFLGETGLTLSGDYHGSVSGDRQSYGAELRYYVRPLGSHINVAPVVGYRYLDLDRHHVEGANVGLRVLVALSRTGAADLSLSQTWVSPGGEEETGITTFSFGYALTPDLRFSTDLQRQNSPYSKDRRVGVLLEWML